MRSVALIAAQLNSCRVKYHSALCTIQWRFSLLKLIRLFMFQHTTNKGKVNRSRGTQHKVFFSFAPSFAIFACFLPIRSAGDGVTGAYSAALTPDLLSDCATLVNVRLSHCQPTTKSNSS